MLTCRSLCRKSDVSRQDSSALLALWQDRGSMLEPASNNSMSHYTDDTSIDPSHSQAL